MKTLTLEMGPYIDKPVPDFQALNHDHQLFALNDLIGERGLFLGFTGDIWEPASVRRILWLQRHYHQFAQLGVTTALLACDEPYKLHGYSMSSLSPLEFPLLSDANGSIHHQFNMDHYGGIILIDSERYIRNKWIMPDERVWPKISDLIKTIEDL